jgi:MFS family permease
MRPTSTAPNLLSPQYLWTTIGSITLIFLAAFEALAVTTIMPTISRELDGEALYSLAFSATLAAGVIGMVVAGGWADRVGPNRPLVTAMAVFVVGLALSGTAADMSVFIVGRFLQGLGSGAINVALYVVVARIYPPELHPRIFGAFAAAWVLPSLIGPPAAGVVADTIGWHWVFLGVGVLVLVAAVAIVPALRQLHAMPAPTERGPAAGWSILWSVVVAAGVLGISLGGERGGALAWPIAGAALVVVVIALRPLLPRRTLLAGAGLPATVLLRGAVAAAFFSTEVYLPYLLHDVYGLPTWLAGVILTVGAVSWAAGSAVQGRLGDRMSHSTTVRIGSSIVFAGIAVQLLTASLLLSPLVAASGWLLAGAGMGLVFPRISTLVLSHSTPRDQGFNSAAMTIADSAGGATSIAFAGLLFAAFGAATGGGFVAALALTTALALAAVPIAFRVRD